MIGLLVVGGFLVICGLLIGIINGDEPFISLLAAGFVVAGLIMMMNFINANSNANGQKQALKGQSDYIMNIRCNVNDSALTPVDTVFTLKIK